MIRMLPALGVVFGLLIWSVVGYSAFKTTQVGNKGISYSGMGWPDDTTGVFLL